MISKRTLGVAAMYVFVFGYAVYGVLFVGTFYAVSGGLFALAFIFFVLDRNVWFDRYQSLCASVRENGYELEAESYTDIRMKE